eukprot:Skav217860  [mRNA]  locus=scaffold5889:110973:112602:- [translate_table: standard]
MIGEPDNGCRLLQRLRRMSEWLSSPCESTINQKRRGYQDRKQFLWHHCRQAPDYEIAVLGKGESVMDVSLSYKKAPAPKLLHFVFAMTMRNLLEDSMRANERLMEERSALEAHILCVICRDNKIDTSFIQCGNTSCSACFSRLPDQADGMKQCPVCRERILATQRIYVPS